MVDPQLLKTQLDAVCKNLRLRGFEFQQETYLELESKRKTLQEETEHLQQQRNSLSKSIGQKKAQGEDVSAIMAKVGTINQTLKSQQETLEQLQQELHTLLSQVPNILDASVPEGKDEEDNTLVSTWGEKPSFDFTPLEHDVLGENLMQMDFKLASKLSGSRFVVLHHDIARLHRALCQFMLNTHIDKHQYQEIYVPALVKRDCFFGTGQLPKFDEDFFDIKGDFDLSLISTAEVPVTNIAKNTLFQSEQLPLRFVAHTPCFRSEAGSYGRDTRGMIRQHQFDKVELIHFCTPEHSKQEHERLLNNAQAILKELNLAHQVVCLCSGDTGFSAAKTFDIEVWLPGQNAYREISSCSNCESFQARRLKARFREPGSKNSQLIHTLNGSGLAVGRTLVAILENYQDENQRIFIPEVLQSYMGGKTHIEPIKEHVKWHV